MSGELKSESQPKGKQAAGESTCDVGIVCALKIEISPFLDMADHVNKVRGGDFVFYGVKLGDRRIAIVETGAGKTPATKGTQALIDGHNPPWILSAGLSGGLAEETRTGDIVVANTVSLDEENAVLNIGQQQEDDQPGVHNGKLVTVKNIVRLVTEKQALHERTGALAVDMETYHVARVCVERKKPFAAIRAISDDLSADLPPEILGILGPKGAVRAGAVFSALLNRPSCVTDLWALRERALQSGERLAKFLKKMLG
ncbi:MAG: 5'-methylthioadenosine nucleosidase [Planctomycetaceae bacterium]|nr:5'-methylthioadenosine nucleosidase [Planctomycetaceae bacterium]MCB9953594.1 5'-methylthioadenosine nucleosidase [Planctomycetaceae bacterium]